MNTHAWDRACSLHSRMSLIRLLYLKHTHTHIRLNKYIFRFQLAYGSGTGSCGERPPHRTSCWPHVDDWWIHVSKHTVPSEMFVLVSLLSIDLLIYWSIGLLDLLIYWSIGSIGSIDLLIYWMGLQGRTLWCWRTGPHRPCGCGTPRLWTGRGRWSSAEPASTGRGPQHPWSGPRGTGWTRLENTGGTVTLIQDEPDWRESYINTGGTVTLIQEGLLH